MPLSNEDRLPPEPMGQPPRTGRFWFDLLAATAAIFISVVSLVVAYRGEHTQRGLLAANSWPFIQLSEDRTSQGSKLDVENAGVGPAKIMTFEITYRGMAVDSPYDLLTRCCGLAPLPAGQRVAVEGLGYGQIYGNVLRPGEHIIALELRKPAPAALMTQFQTALKEISYRSCYCSILQECWTSDLQSLDQNPVAACPVAAHPFVMER